MAVKTYRLAATTTNNSADLLEADQTAANRTDGWTSAKLAAAQMAEFDAGTKQASGAFSATAKPASFLTGTTCNAFGTINPLNGKFANTNWTFTFAMRCGTASAQRGRVRLRVFKSANANGSGATELTGATQIGTTVAAALSTTTDQTSVVTWSPGAVITLNNEYLFFVIAWEITTAGGSNSADVLLRTGQAAGGTRIDTPDFTPTPTISLNAGLSLTPSLALRKPFAATPVGEISLTEGGVPLTRTDHVIKARARKTSASDVGKLRVQLFEGATARSAEFETTALTTSFTDYNFAISDVDAASITNYGNLSLRFYGVSSSGSLTVFEISQISLNTPAGLPVAPTTPIALAAGLSMTPALATEQAYRRSLDSAPVITPVLSKALRAYKTIPATATVTPAISKAVTGKKSVDATLPLTTAHIREPSRLLAGSLVLTPGILKLAAFKRALAAGLPVTSGLQFQKLISGSIDYASEVLADNPISYWRLGESSGTVADDERNLHDGAITGAIVPPVLGVPGLLNNGSNTAMEIQGQPSQGVQIPNHADYQIGTLTLETWVKTTHTDSSWRSIVVKQHAYSIFNYSGNLAAYIWGTSTVISTGVPLHDGIPHHVVLVCQEGVPGGSQFYCDGVPVGSAFTYATSNHTEGLSFGYNPAAGQEFFGVIDEVAIYGTVLSPARIAAHYETGIATGTPGISLAASAPLTPALNKEPSRLQAASLALTPAVTKEPSRSLPVGLTLTPAISKIAAHYRALTSGLTLTPALARKLTTARALAAGLTISPALNKEPSRSLTAGLPLTTALLREMYELFPGSLTLTPGISAVAGKGKTLPVSLVLTPTLNEKQVRTLSSGLVISPALNRKLGRSFSASLPLTGNFLREMYEPFPVGLTLTPAISDIATHYKTLTSVLSLPPALVRVFTAEKALAAALVVSPALNRELAKPLTAAITLTPSLIREIQRPAFGAVNLALSPTMTRLARHYMTMSAGISLNPSIAVKIGGKMYLAADLLLNPALVKEPTRFISSGLVLSPALTRQMAYRRSISASLPLTAALIEAERYRRTLSAVLSLSPALALKSTHVRAINASLALTAALSKEPSRRLTAGLPLSAALSLIKTLRLPILLAAELQLISELEVSTAEEIELATDLHLLAVLFRVLPPIEYPPPDEILGGLSKPVIISANGGDEAQIISVGSESLYVGK